ncbi:hypothetical protein NDU88_003007 [Pleurodeles waltl]|uniref:Uncharacterized protein n=1 Tax=Pleurodeles waltl TaxID=8319 RepID=A0AAV7KUF6_PLEWA|nr:hypothetical protein NDU88_003007 [Pleurodeles waltl]
MNAPVPHVEAANQEYLTAAKEGPGSCCAGQREPKMPVAGRREARNGGVRSSSTGREGGDNKRKSRGEEEADGGPETRVTQEA